MKAVWNDEVLAESEETIIIEGNHYFPPDSITMKYFSKTDHHTVCPWKGDAHYYTITVKNEVFENGAWYYPEPKEPAKRITGYIAFYPKVNVS